MEQFNNKYRIQSARAPWWDYGNAGAYFITICTKNREHFFGEIQEAKMICSPVGAIADVLWHEIPNHANNVELDAFVVMPNHIHGILILNENNLETESKTELNTNIERDIINNFENNYHPRFRNPGKNTVSSIIGGYKSAVTKHANRLGLKNGWQPRFYDHIIRDDAEYQRIKNYISNNISNWKQDKFY